MLPHPDLSGFSEEERMQLMTVMKKAQVNFKIMRYRFAMGRSLCHWSERYLALTFTTDPNLTLFQTLILTLTVPLPIAWP